jgi:glycosyltransferase involved in cell wall biosynthesis
MITDDLSGRIARKIINRYADTVIAISGQTAKGLPNAKIMENPFDMYRSRQYRNVRDQLKVNLGLSKESFIVSVFSAIGIQKGTEFLLEVVHRIPMGLPICFVLVGNPVRGEQKLYRDLSELENVRIFPQTNDMDKFYAITDVLLRCEGYLPLGRTVYEGIYGGCIAVLPVSLSDSLKEIEPYKDQIVLFHSGNAKECANRIVTLWDTHRSGIPDNGFEPTGNVPESARKLLTVFSS